MESEQNEASIVRMEGPDTFIRNLKDHTEENYSFDYSYWSQDGFMEDKKHCLKAQPGSNYIDQNHIFSDLGIGALNDLFNGYNASIIAIGKIGTGKTYTMTGSGENKGIIPLACQELFKRIDMIKADTTREINFEVSLQMFEIYNEKI